MAYIPGFSSQIFGAGLGRDIRSTQQELLGLGKGLQESQFKQKVMGSLLGQGGKYLGTALAGMVGGPLAAVALPALMRGAGQYFGGKMAGRGPKIPGQSETGLLGSQFDMLKGIRGDMPEAWKGAALGAAGSELISGLTSEAGKELMSSMGSKFNLGEYGKAAGVDPSAAMQNLAQVQGPTGTSMGRRMPEIGKNLNLGQAGVSAAGREVTDLSRYGEARDLRALQAAGMSNPMDVGEAGLRFGRQAAGGAFSPEMYQANLPTPQELSGTLAGLGKQGAQLGQFTGISPVESQGMPRGGLMDLLRSSLGGAGDALTRHFGKNYISFGNAPQGQVWPERLWGKGFQEGGEVESDDEQFSEHYIDWLYMLEKEDPKGFIKQITDWKKRGQSPEDYFDMYNSAIESGEFRPDSLYMKYNPDFISPSPMWHPDTLEKKRQEREMMPKMDPSRYQEGGQVGSGDIMSHLQGLQRNWKQYQGDIQTESGDLRYGPKGMFTQAGLAEKFDFPLESAQFDTLYGQPGDARMGIDISIPDRDQPIKYIRSGPSSDKFAELFGIQESAKSELERQHPGTRETFSTKLGGDYSEAIAAEEAGFSKMDPMERLDYEMDQYRKVQEPKQSDAERRMKMKALGFTDDAEYDRFLKFKEKYGYQLGGHVPQYQMGGLIQYRKGY